MMSSYRDLSGDEVTRLAVLAPSLEGSESPICVQDGFWIAPASIRCREPILKVSVFGLYGSAAPPPTRFLFRRKHYARRPRRIAALTPNGVYGMAEQNGDAAQNTANAPKLSVLV